MQEGKESADCSRNSLFQVTYSGNEGPVTSKVGKMKKLESQRIHVGNRGLQLDIDAISPR